jgi:acetyl-CoA C-acetyltransferase
MNSEDVLIISAKRTPNGSMLGQLASLSAPQLASVAHKAVIAAADLNPRDIDEVFSGCVLQAGIGQAPARQAAIYAGIPDSVGATTINKMCGSGLKAVLLAHDLIKASSGNIILASGMESMSQAPYLLSKARTGYRLGHGALKDHMFLDGLEDAYDSGKLMGYFADDTAKKLHFTRESQDAFAIRSMQRALDAQKAGFFDEEIALVAIQQKNDTKIISQDEGPNAEKLCKVKVRHLKPAFHPDGTVTAANSSAISDGAASVLVMSRREASRRGLSPLAKIVAHATFSCAPSQFTTAPIYAIESVLKKASWKANEVDLYEINEAFAVVAMATITALKLDESRVNIHGGACALGHPIGATGARILVTLIHALKQHGMKKGIAALCIGGGEAVAVAIEMA